MSDADHVLYNGNIHTKIVIVLCYSSVEMVIVAGWRQLGVGIEGTSSSNNCLLAGIKTIEFVGSICKFDQTVFVYLCSCICVFLWR